MKERLPPRSPLPPERRLAAVRRRAAAGPRIAREARANGGGTIVEHGRAVAASRRTGPEAARPAEGAIRRSTMMLFAYPAAIERHPPRFFRGRRRPATFAVAFRDFPEAVSEGASRREAIEAARAVLDAAVELRVRERRALPSPSRKSADEVLIGPSPTVAAKAALIEAMRAAGDSNVALARRLGLAESEIRRMLDFRHATKIDRLDDAFRRGYGRRLWLGVEELPSEVA
jgi:antitoxin HicB